MLFNNYDVVIVGTGVSGLYAALNLGSSLRVLMLSKADFNVCNSSLAQGGVAAVIDQTEDSFDRHANDTLTAGGFTNDKEHLAVLVESGPKEIEKLLSYGVQFDRDDNGELSLALEGGHSRRRIVHSKDSTGFSIVSTLTDRVKLMPNVKISENAALVGFEKRGDKFLLDIYKDKRHVYVSAATCLFATGGIGRLYEYTTNSTIATGDGIFFALEAGAEVKNLSLIQFHPTAFASKDKECFLISEAVRGEGAILLNGKGERFMPTYEPERKELAPRDVVSRCILAEQAKTGSGDFFLDISFKEASAVKARFPMIYERVLQKGYDITKTPIPIYPCQHYLMGGINVDTVGRTDVDGLYAAGECAHTGVHGNNRLASNSLLEALVFAGTTAVDINERYSPSDVTEININDYIPTTGVFLHNSFCAEVRRIMQAAYFIEPNLTECERGLKRLNEMTAVLAQTTCEPTPEYAETKSAVRLATIILGEILFGRQNI
ncbi:MAG: FAD-binding protein [Oscillospiraceae bacterium]|jgi:L-aspartate oxidase|nr:FAD-binding protein [Oscillospiraceae bacterium]